MNDSERLNLQKMVEANETQNNTDKIRNLKHSKKILSDVDQLLFLKKEYARTAKSNPQLFDQMCTSKCSFLFNNYTDIFNKVKKDEIDLQILTKLINVLYLIEEGKLDQHEGSFEVGKLLKEIYIDSALKKAEKLDEKYEKGKKVQKKRPVENISWKDYKKNHNI
tara:strand:- start:2951 stop:3445 length:495 start_codon:yes stop_codon:yes gene_type:complete